MDASQDSEPLSEESVKETCYLFGVKCLLEKISNNDLDYDSPSTPFNTGFTIGPKTITDIHKYLDPVIFHALEFLCGDDQLTQKYMLLPKRVLENIFVDTTPTTIIQNKIRPLDTIGLEFYSLIQILKEYCEEKLKTISKNLVFKLRYDQENGVTFESLMARVDLWLVQNRRAVKSAIKR